MSPRIDPLALGRMDQWVTLESPLAAPVAVSSLTRDGIDAIATTATAHGYESGEEVQIAGATDDAYNRRTLITVEDTDQFRYTVEGTPDTPATGTITVTYVGDGQGGVRDTWTAFAQVPAEVVPLSGDERIQAMAVASRVTYRVRITYREDVTPRHRLIWDAQTLQILSVVRVDGGRRFLSLDCGELR